VRISESVATTLGRQGVQEVLAGTEGGTRTFDLRAGAIAIRFECRFSVEDAADGGLRVSAVGVAPRAGFTADVGVTAGDESMDVEGEVLVSGTLAGLGQRELRFWTQRLLEEVLSAPDASQRGP
jgi:hypothetical protein